MALAAAGLFLSGARGAQADRQRDGYNRDDPGTRYQRSDWHAERAVPQDARQGRGDAWGSNARRSDTADRVDERGRGRWGQNPFAYVGEADRWHHGTGNRQVFGHDWGQRNDRDTYRDGTSHRGSNETAHHGDRSRD